VPDFPIIDAHVHLWDPPRFEIPWLNNVPVLNEMYVLEQYYDHTRGVEIEAFVYEEIDIAPDYRLLEVREAAAYAKADPRLRGIVASAPLEYGDQVREFLKALVGESDLVRGVRRLLQDEQDNEYCLRPRFLRGVELLAEFDLSFDICIRHQQMPAVIEMVRRLPQIRFVLDHIGKPPIKAQQLDPWRDHISELASLPNVSCKISGVVTEADHEAWTIEHVAPYIQHVLDAFGEDRVMYASDWPVATQASTYQRWVETLDSITSDWSDAAKHKLWAENARAFYRLGGGATG
jgi:L-fuconolactonase